MLSTSGLLGYGFPRESLDSGMAARPDVIGVDGGSTDPGPYYLGAGKCLNSPLAMKRDLREMLAAARHAGIPLVVASCGGAGGAPHLRAVTEIVREIARQDGHCFTLATIAAEQDKAWVKARLAAGAVKALRNVPELTAAEVDAAEHIVACMGPEPIARALDMGAEVVLAGRASDPAPWAAAAMRAGCSSAAAWYAGKMLECGATAAWPKGHDCLSVTIDGEGVVCEPPNPARRCTPASLANHSLHENPSPVHHQEPGGVLDTTDCDFTQVGERATRVTGMRWHPDARYTVKIEGARLIGQRAVVIAGTRDPGLVAIFDAFLDDVRANVARKVADFGLTPADYRLAFRVYGRDGVMATREPLKDRSAHELGVLAEVVADDEDAAAAVLAVVRTNLLHVDFPGRLCKEGNMAFPFSPTDIACGPAYRFNVHHTVALDDPLEIFPVQLESVGG
jgi:hypothetical protein